MTVTVHSPRLGEIYSRNKTCWWPCDHYGSGPVVVQRKQRKLKTKTSTNRGHIRLKKSGDYYWLLWIAVSPGRNYITVYSVIIQIKYFTPHNNLFIAHQIFLVHKNHRIAWVFLSLSAVYSKYWNRIRRLLVLPNIFYRPKLGTRQKPLEVFYSCNLI